MTKLYPFQRKGVRALRLLDGRALLADEMGLGKTVQTLTYIKEENIRNVIVVCPASLKWNWQREAMLHVGIRAEVLEGRNPPSSHGGLTVPHRMLILNYEILDAWLSWLKSQGLGRSGNNKGHSGDSGNKKGGNGRGLVVFDEAHYLKNPSAKRTKAARELSRVAGGVLALTGTPLTNRPSDLWSVLNIVRPDLYPSRLQFGFRFCQARKIFGRWDFRGAVDLDELHTELRGEVMIRRTKKQVLKDLPKKVRSVIPLAIAGKADYDKIEHDYKAFLRESGKAILSDKRTRAIYLGKLAALRRHLGRLKLNHVIAWVEDYLEESDEKLILFGYHRHVIETLHARFPSVLVHGRVKGKKRMAAVDRFQLDPECRVFVGQIGAAGVGLNLTAASAVAFTELSWTPGEHSQAEDRAHRIKQLKTVNCYYLIAQDTIEEKLCRLIQEKQEVLDEVLDGKAGVSRFNIHKLLLKELSR